MATVVLQTIGTVVGGAVGGPIGAVVGRAVGALAGSAIDQRLFSSKSNSKDRVIEGPRLDAARILTSSEGAPIPKVYGRSRISGEIIWATRFEEVVTVTTTTSGGGGGGGGKGGRPSAPTTTTTTKAYTYFANFAVGLCEGPISCLRRVWANGQELDLTKIDYRFYNGSESQSADPLIEAKQGGGNAPAYRGLAYVVFDSFPLEEYGNRIPQLTFEIVRSIGKLETQIRSMSIIPGSTEYGYSPSFISGGGGAQPFNSHNRHTNIAITDWKASLDELQAVCPNLQTISLVVAWFGTDLRAGNCRIIPGITRRNSEAWSVAGKTRANAHVVSYIDGRPVYGGTPSDASVLAAIADIKARGLRVVFYPFIMMDIPNANGLPNPNGGTDQPVYPWRGEITCFPAPGQPGTADKTSTARTQLNTFANRSDGSYRSMILHYANLCSSAGGVDVFIVGSEMRSVTRVRDQNGNFPFVETLTGLAASARQILGAGTDITYAADWSEYFGYQPTDGSGDVLFNLDPLWASPNVDAVGIDNYMPLADWRGSGDPEALDVHSTHDIEYLQSNIIRGEGYDWYYASSTDRENGTRTPITDGQGEPWVYRYKDIQSWWSNPHHNRIGGVRSATPTAWQPQSKRFYFTELGCPAVDKGANQPNVFYDPKSDQSALPYFSSAARDDLIQRRFLQAHFDFWAEAANNPVSSVYGGRMLKVEEITPWCWDARPFPWFPLDLATWSDGDNWHLGHWLNGRLGGCSLQELILQALKDHGHDGVEISVNGYLDGFVIPDVSSARAALEPALSLFNVFVVEENGKITFREQAYSERHELAVDATIQEGGDPQKISQRAAELELPGEIIINHMALFNSYEQTGTKSHRLEGGSDRQISINLPAVLNDTLSFQLAERHLRDAWQARETCEISIPAKFLKITVGDVVHFDIDDRKKWLVESVETGAQQELSLRAIEDFSIVSNSPPARQFELPTTIVFGQPEAYILDLPLLRSADSIRHLSHIAVRAKPWAGAYSIFSSPLEDGFNFRAGIQLEATIGTVLQPISSGKIGVWDKGNKINISLPSGSFEAASENAVLNGANIALLETESGKYELLHFVSATLLDDGTWELANLIRGQFGTEAEMHSGALAGAKFILLDQGILPLELETQEIGLEQNWRIGPARDNVSSQTYTQIEHVNAGRSRLMFSPVHLKAKASSEDIAISWIRRGRIDSDNWDPAEIPLDASLEQYLVRIHDDVGALKREVTTTSQSYLYLESDRTTDFAGPTPSFEIQVAQLGDNGLPGSFASLSHTHS